MPFTLNPPDGDSWGECDDCGRNAVSCECDDDGRTADDYRRLLAAAERRESLAAAASDAADSITAGAAAMIREGLSLMMGGTAAGLPIDLSAVLAAAVERAVPAAPERVAAIVAPEPIAPAAPAATAGATRRTRRRVERVWTNVQSGSIWTCTLAGVSGRVKITVDDDGNGATFLATTGNRGTFRSPSRAVQSACGNPAGAGRKGEATVNGFLALTLADGSGGETTLDGITAV